MRVQVIKDKKGHMIVEDVQVRERLKEYFVELLNFEGESEARVLAIGREGKIPLLRELNDRPTGKDEIQKALGGLKIGKALGLDGTVSELLKYGWEVMVL